MTTKERLLATLSWGKPDKIPLTVYEMLFPRGEACRLVRNAGVGLIYRPPAHREAFREVEIQSREYWENSVRKIRRTIRTPVGEVWQTLQPDTGGYGTSNWIKEHFIKRPDDYRVMEYYIKDPVYHDNFAELNELIRRVGDDGLVYVRIAKSPIQEMLYQMMGLERFSLDYYDRRDLFDSLHSTMLVRYQELYDLAARSPVEIILLGDNITGDVVGKERFREYLMPVYKALSKKLTSAGKKLAVHMDGRLDQLKDLIAEAEFDIIEAFTPTPMGDVSLAEGRMIWPDKAIWINFPSSLHIADSQTIASHTRRLVQEAGDKRGFAIGVTEDAPLADLERSLAVIGGVLDESA